MNLVNKYTKGQFEYAKYNKIKMLLLTAGMYSLSAAIYLAGLITTGSNKNLLTIVAVLGILPASKLLISAIMNCRVKTVDESLKKEIDSAVGNLKGFYHLYFTSYDINFYLVHCVVTHDSFICYSDDSSFNEKKFQEHIEKHMKIDKIPDVLIKVFNDKDAYINRLNQLKATGNDKTNKKLCELIINISL